LFGWLLWGDFAFTFFECIFGRFLPLYLKDLQASNALIGIMGGTIAGGVNILFLPGISQWSDRCRTPWGRRIPFLAVATPITVVALILVGFAPELGGWLHRSVVLRVAPAIPVTAVILTVLCIFVVCFHLFNMVLCNAFNWLVREVVPQEWMARFLSWFRIVSTVSSVFFSWYVFPYIISYRREVCVTVGIFYLVVFLLMCWKVKEGEYPPARMQEHKPGIIKSFGLYFRDCFSVPLYRHYFYAITLFSLGCCAGPFYMLFFRNSLGLSMDDMGKIFALELAVKAVTYLPMGWLCDKIVSVRLVIASQVGMLALTLLAFFFITGKNTLILFTVVNSIVWVGWSLGSAMLAMELFPEEKFAQLSAGANIFGCGVGIVGNYLVGLFMDFSNNNYRIAYLWAALGGLSFIPLISVYRGWKQHGGPLHYKAPLPE
jgi:MFS family permease